MLFKVRPQLLCREMLPINPLSVIGLEGGQSEFVKGLRSAVF